MKKTKRNNKAMVIIGWILSLIQLILSIIVVVFVFKLGVLSTLYNVLMIVGLVVLLVLTRWLLWKSNPIVKWVIGAILSVVISVVCSVGIYYINGALNMINSVTTVEEEYTNIGVYVLVDDPANSVVDAKDYTFGYVQLEDEDIINESVNRIQSDISSGLGMDTPYTIKTKAQSDMLATADGLIKHDTKAIILDEAFIDVMSMETGYENVPSQVKKIASYRVSKKLNTNIKKADNVFAVYISGIDVWGDINIRSRSDVNIIAVVNPTTHQILLITTPRDYYVPLSVSHGVKDKLTHAGLYGINCSMDTLAELYGTNIDYFFRVNFSGFEKIINSLGGVDVDSEVAFHVEPDFNYHVGVNHLNGLEALAFARERYAFAEGDRQRAKDQMAVIKGVVNGLASSNILNDYSGVMQGLEGSFQTNIPYDLITTIVSKQLAEGTKWDIQSYSADGTGASRTTYSMPNFNAYVVIPNQDSVDRAKELINRMNNNEVISVE